jgi:hypothetical protein
MMTNWRRYLILGCLIFGLSALPVWAQETTPAAETTPEAPPPTTNEATSEPVEIQVAVQIINISEFNLETGSYIADFYVLLRCSRPCTDDEASIDFIGIVGSEGLNQELRVREADYFEYRVQALLSRNDIDLSRFPFDSHRLNIVIESKLATTAQVRYVPYTERTFIDEDVTVQGWGLNPNFEVRVQDKIYTGYTDAFARYIFSLEVYHLPIAAILRDILPALVVLAINFLVSFMPDRHQRLGIFGGLLLAMVVHHLTVSGEVPPVNYAIYFDALMLLNHLAIMVQFGLTTYELVIEKRGTPEAEIDQFTRRSLVMVVVLWVVAQALIYIAFAG